MLYNRFRYIDFDIVVAGKSGILSNLLIGFSNRDLPEIPLEWIYDETAFLEAKKQIIQYLGGQRRIFDLELAPTGTPFQQKVWQQLQKIPYGTTISYKQLATSAGNPKASQAVGSANGKNPLPIIIPCHRVIASNGNLSGYAYGKELKQYLIDLEKLNLIFDKLENYYRVSKWWPGNNPYIIMIGAVLTQNTTWKNVEKALNNFANNIIPDYLEKMQIEELANFIKPCGYYNQKAQTLKNLTAWFKQYSYDPVRVEAKKGSSLRKELLSIKGIGPETADSILLYAFNKPFFVIDAYTRRILSRLGFDLPIGYETLRLKIEGSIPKDALRYGNLHGCIVNHGKTFCLKKPDCLSCPLADICPKLSIPLMR